MSNGSSVFKRIDNAQNLLMQNQTGIKEVLELLSRSQGQQMNENQKKQIYDKLHQLVKSKDQIRLYLKNIYEQVPILYNTNETKQLIKQKVDQKEKERLIKKVKDLSYKDFKYEFEQKEIFYHKLEFIQNRLKENMLIYCSVSKDKKFELYIFVWKSLFCVHMNIMFQRNQRNNDKIIINDIVCSSLKDSIASDLQAKELEYSPFQLKGHLVDSVKDLKNLVQEYTIIPQFSSNSIIYEKITAFVRRIFLKNNQEIEMEVLFIDILNKYNNIFNPNVALCNKCQKHLKFHSKNIGFLPPTVIKNDHFYHEICDQY